MEGPGRWGVALTVEVNLDETGLLGALLTSPIALGECAASADGSDPVVEVEFEFVERTPATYSEPGVFSLDFSSEGVGLSSLLVFAGLSKLATGGVGIRGVDSSA